MLYNNNCIDIIKDMPAGSIDCIITDPPYGVLSHKIETKIDIKAFFKECYRVLKDNKFIIFFGQQPTLTDWIIEANKLFKYKNEIIWHKRQPNICFKSINKIHENIMVYTKGHTDYINVNVDYLDVKLPLAEFIELDTIKCYVADLRRRIKDPEYNKKEYETPAKYEYEKYFNDEIYRLVSSKQRRRSTEFVKYQSVVAFYPENKKHIGSNNIKHPTVKPTNLIESLIKLTTNENDLILDPFMGSGTTGIACKFQKRKFIGVELDKNYFELASERIANARLNKQKTFFDN